MKGTYKKFYSITLVLTLTVLLFGGTYAYFAASVSSDDGDLDTGSGKFSLNLSVIPKYPSSSSDFFKLIPMRDEFAIAAFSDEFMCRDKSGAGACYAYDIKVYDYSSELEYVTGKINIETSGISNLSYMLFQKSDVADIIGYYDDGSPKYYDDVIVNVDDDGNPIYYTPVIEEYDSSSNRIYYNRVILDDDDGNPIYIKKITSLLDEPLGKESFYLKDSNELNLVLVIWLSDILDVQNDIDIGTFNGSVIFSAGSGGQITGNISSSIVGMYEG